MIEPGRGGERRSSRRFGALACAAGMLLACRSAATPHEPTPESARHCPGSPSTPTVPNRDGWWRGQVFYEIFVRSFADSDGDGIGDLRGLAEHLDYLNDGNPSGGDDLGVDALWLMPIHPSPSYHGYDVTDYRAVHPDYGTLADLDHLLEEAHARGVRIIIDLVLNHTSRQHPWFIASQRGVDDPLRAFYHWRRDPPPWRRPWDGAPVWHPLGGWYYYALFWSGMPDLNLGNPEVEAAMLDAACFWLARGVDGFRVDAARHLFESESGTLVDQPASHAFAQRMRARLDAEYPETLLVAEAWTNTQNVAPYYGSGNEYQLAFDFELAGGIKTSLEDGVRSSLRQALALAETAFVDRGFEAPFLANHDMVRVMRDLSGDAAAARLAAALLLAMPGSPFLYYGEEIGMQGGAAERDEDKRTPMRWTGTPPGYGFTSAERTWYGTSSEAAEVSVDAQRGDSDSLWRLYRRLIALRHNSAALQQGEATMPAVRDGARGVLALLRATAGERVLLVVNLHGQTSGPFSVELSGAPRLLVQEGLAAPPTPAGGFLRFAGLAGRAFAFVALD